MTPAPIAPTPAPFKYVTKAHPTIYGGVTFRSRLEATWAAFFDIVKWQWAYEPIDLHGWVPDFIVNEKIAVEVKPIYRIDQMPLEIAKMRASNWPGPLIILGAQPRCYRTDDDKFGWTLKECSFSGSQLFPDVMRWFTCYDEGENLVYSYESEGGMGPSPDFLDEAWSRASGITRWKAQHK